MVHNCERCNYSFERLTDYKRHLNRKNICSPLKSNIPVTIILEKLTKKVNYKCDNCNKGFIHSSSLYRHKKDCLTDKEKIEILLQKVKILEQQNKGNTTINNNYNTVNNININAYGTFKPTINYTQLQKLLNIGAYKAIKMLIDTNHFNKDKPENMNFYISNYKDNIGRIYDGESWVIKDGDHLVDEIYDLYQSLVDSAIEELQDSDNEEEQKNKIVEKMTNTIELWCKRTNNNKFINGIKEDLKKHFHGKKDIVKKVHNIK